MAYNSTMGLLGGAGGGYFNDIENSIFPNAANGAMPYEQQALNQMPGYYQPYMNAGQSMLNPLMSQYSQLMNNPGGMMNQIGSQFHSSPGFNFAMRQAMMGGNQASAAGGMAGSPMANQQNQQMATNLANQNYYNWMGNALGMYGQGLQGAQGMAGMGAGMANNFGTNMADILNNQADISYAGQANQNQETGGLIGDIMHMF